MSQAPVVVAGGGRSQNVNGNYVDPTFVIVTGSNTGSTASLGNFIQNDYIIVVVSFSGTGATVLSVSDTASPATSFSKTASSNVNDDTEIWCGQHTAASGADTITVKSTAAATYAFTVYAWGGLTSCTENTGATNSGTTAALSVGSFTPTTGDSCIGEGTETNTVGGLLTWSDSNPFLLDHSGGSPLFSAFVSGNRYAISITRGSWNSFDGPTTATITPSGSTAPAWDEVVACYPTGNGNEMYTETSRGGLRSGASPQTAGVDNILHGDYYLDPWGSVGGATLTGVTVSAVGQPTFTGSKVSSTNVHNDVELWIVPATATTSGAGGMAMSNAFSGTCTECTALAEQIGGILSTTPQAVYTSSGTSGGTASIAAVTPPANDLCIAQVTGTTSTSGASVTNPANQPFQFLVSGSSGNNLFAFSIRANWPSGVSTTAAFNLPAGGATTWTAYDELVTCFAGSYSSSLSGSMSLSSTITQAPGVNLPPSLGLDESASAVCTAATSCSATLSTSNPNDVIIALCYANGNPASLSASGGALIWTSRTGLLNSQSNDVTNMFYATASSTLSSASLACSKPTSFGNIGIHVWGIRGANTATPFDPNVNLPNTPSSPGSSNPSCTMTTSNPNDFLIALTVHGGVSVTSSPSGFTLIQSKGGTPGADSYYEVVSSTQSGVSENWMLSSSSANQEVCDAVQATTFINLGSTVNQNSSVTVASSLGLAPSLAWQAVLSATEAVALSLSQTINQQVADTAAGSLGLGASVGQDAGVVISDLASLSSSLNQGGGIPSSASVSLTSAIGQDIGAAASAAVSLVPSLLASGFNSLLSGAVSLLSQLGQGISVSNSASAALTPSLGQQAGFLDSAAVSLVSIIGQDLSQTSSAAVSLTSGLTVGGLGVVLNVVSNLSATIYQDLGVQVSGSVSLLASLLIDEFVATFNLLVNLSSTVNPGLGVVVSAVAALVSSLGNSVPFRALFTIAETLRPLLSQGIGGLATLLSATVNLVASTLTSLSAQVGVGLSATPGLNLGVQAAMTGLAILKSIIGSIFSILTSSTTSTTSTGTTTTPGVPIIWFFWLPLILLLLLFYFLVIANRRRKKEEKETYAESLAS